MSRKCCRRVVKTAAVLRCDSCAMVAPREPCTSYSLPSWITRCSDRNLAARRVLQNVGITACGSIEVVLPSFILCERYTVIAALLVVVSSSSVVVVTFAMSVKEKRHPRSLFSEAFVPKNEYLVECIIPEARGLVSLKGSVSDSLTQSPR